MRRIARIIIVATVTILSQHAGVKAQGQSSTSPAYLGFDRNDYPGDENLARLHQTFSYTGFWLNSPPREKTNTWAGKRRAVEATGLGFLVLYNGRPFAALKTVSNAGRLGKSDAQSAIAAAQREGFPAGALIFLDQEEGGRMLPEQKAYFYAWVDEITAGGFRAGIYCSGIAAKEDGAGRVITAEDIQQSAVGRKIAYWVSNDACPPSPGCAFPQHPPSPAESGVNFAEVWQFAQSPKRRDFASGCPKNYDRDGSCYPPVIDPAMRLHIDVNTAASADPSKGRAR